MIAVSSLRPQSDCPEDIWNHQQKARASWEQVFDEVIYLGPEIKANAVYLGQRAGWGALLNADIIVGKHFKSIEQRLLESGARCAMSRRWQIPETGEMAQARVVDLGLDFFCAEPAIWSRVADTITPEFKMGKILWDTWMITFFMEASQGRCADLTNQRVIFHPTHGNRRDQNLTPTRSKYLYVTCWPNHRI